MTPACAQRKDELLSDCIVSPDVFNQMVDRLGAFVVPYQQAMETEAGQHSMHLYLQGLLSHFTARMLKISPRSRRRQVIQDFIGIAPWIITLGDGSRISGRALGEPDGILAFDPSSFPKRGTPVG